MTGSPRVITCTELRDFDHHDTSPAELSATYAALHEGCPVAHSERHGGFYLLCGYGDVKHAASRWQDFSSAGGHTLPKLPFPVAAIGFDPPEHTFWRNLYREVMNLVTYRSYQERLLVHACRLIDGFAARGRAELVAELTDPLPVMSICEIIGIDDPDRARIARGIALDLYAQKGNPAAIATQLDRYRAFCLEEVEFRRRHPREDFLTRLAVETFDGKLLAEDDISSLLIGFLIAGHHTTTSAMSSMLLRVSSAPELRAQLRAEPELVGRVVEETIRLDTPLHGFFRQTTRDIEVREIPIPAGSEVMLNYAAANRDPSVFADPDEFNLDRGSNPHLGFGHGLHTCVGAQLARLELRLVLTEILRLMPDIAYTGEPIRQLWSGGNLQMIDRLPVRFTPAR
jgi:cytochrome P450